MSSKRQPYLKKGKGKKPYTIDLSSHQGSRLTLISIGKEIAAEAKCERDMVVWHLTRGTRNDTILKFKELFGHVVNFKNWPKNLRK